MVFVCVRVLGPLEDLFGGRELVIDVPKGSSVENLLSLIEARGGEKMQTLMYCNNGVRNEWVRILLNGRDIRFLTEEKLFLEKDDVVHIMPTLGGG